MRGHTLLELIISMFLLGLLLAAIFLVFFQGARAWGASDANSELLQQGTSLLSHLDREIERSTRAGVLLESESLAALSAVDEDGHFRFAADGRPDWRAYVLFYRTSDNIVRRRYMPAAGVVMPPRPIDKFDLGSGERPLNFYCSDGRPATHMVTAFTPSWSAEDRGLEVSVVLKNLKPGLRHTPNLELHSTMLFRN